jgi:hypothetical protein
VLQRHRRSPHERDARTHIEFLSADFGVIQKPPPKRSLDGAPSRNRISGLRPLMNSIPTFVPVDVAEDFVLMCNYTGKEVVE